MNENLLLKISLFFSVTGIVLIFIISRSIEINDTTIRKITQGEAEQEILLTGKVSEIHSSDKVTILKIQKTETIDVVMFEPDLNFQKGSKVKIKGSVDEQNDKYTIIADKIEIITS
ncbi:hypothetical protein GF327_09540 [Candidatus Woesearchaeota archaeon]|nr:hypothetical protein [Candidatus Woesearchaeota archaeon]